MERRHFNYLLILAAVCAVIVACGAVLSEFRAPSNAAVNVIVPIEKNARASEVADELYADHIIRSTFSFKVAITVMRAKNRIGAGDYIFTKPESVWTVATRLINSEQDLPSTRVTLPEGLTVGQMSLILNQSLGSSSIPVSATSTIISNIFADISQFSQSQFLSLASTSEGYLFPDTYLFLPNDTAATVVSEMKANFNKKIVSIQPQINAFLALASTTKSGITENDVVIMASILEKEAASTTDQRIIAGILWKRLESGQLLEADPTIVYGNLVAGQKTSVANVITSQDLASNSLYNTYKVKGLPPTPIDNPGIGALTAAVTPISTNYWFYLSDSKGVMHYSTTYTQQQTNQVNYLGN